jgi:urocanate hydratase
MALSGERGDIARVDRLALELFPGEDRLQRWLAIAGKYVRFQGLPARVAWFQQSALAQFACAINHRVGRGELSAPILLGFHSMASEASAADAASMQNGACWAWSRGAVSTPPAPNVLVAQAIVADGTPDAAERLAIWPAA